MATGINQTCWRLVDGGLALRVRVTVKSSRDQVDNRTTATADGPAVAVRVRAVPEDGAANAAVARVVADWLGVPKSSVAVTGGLKSRTKCVTISGDGAALLEKLPELKGEP
jgi:uncharacterized protein